MIDPALHVEQRRDHKEADTKRGDDQEQRERIQWSWKTGCGVGDAENHNRAKRDQPGVNERQRNDDQNVKQIPPRLGLSDDIEEALLPFGGERIRFHTIQYLLPV